MKPQFVFFFLLPYFHLYSITSSSDFKNYNDASLYHCSASNTKLHSLFTSIYPQVFESLVSYYQESDVDLAIIGDSPFKLDEILDLELFFENLLKREIDLLYLRSPSLDLLVKINILTTCRIIYSTDNNKNFNILYNKTDRIYTENENFIHFRNVDVLL